MVPGHLRDGSVVVGNVYRGAPWQDCGFLLDRLAEWLSGSEFVPPDAGLVVPIGIIKAVLAHVYLAWIHPFGNGNGRTARLLEFQILLDAGVPTPAAHLLSNHYNETRERYYAELAQASRSGGNVLPFVEYALTGFVDGLRTQIEFIRAQQLEVAWENYVTERLEGEYGPVAERRKRLVLALGSAEEPVPKEHLTDLSPAIARDYAGNRGKTLTRDLNALVEKELIRRERDGKYVANWESILAFLPQHVVAIRPKRIP